LQKHSEIINNNFKNNDFDSVKKESQKIKDSMKKIKEEYKEVKDLNDALKNPIGLLNFEKKWII
jgi:archaellum component FlaC